MADDIRTAFESPLIKKAKANYLLDLQQDNPQGRSKAKFFNKYGFSADNCEQFINALIEHTQTAKLVSDEKIKHGRRLVFSCNMNTLSGKAVCIKSVWQIDRGGRKPKLITAYPED